MTALATFTFAETGDAIRIVLVDGEPWFVAADVCRVLGIANARDAVSRLPERMKGVGETDTPGGVQKVGIVSEAGVYRLIMRSNMPAAERFQDWLSEEVVPSIRQTGRYEVAPALPKSYAEALRELASTVEQRDAVKAELAIAAPKADSFDAYQSADGTHSFSEVAKMLHAETGLGRNNLMRRLREARVLMANNEPYQQYAHHFHVVAQWFEHADGTREVTNTTRVRASGVDFIRRKLARSDSPPAAAVLGAAGG